MDKSQRLEYYRNRTGIESDIKIVRIKIKDLEFKRLVFVIGFALSILFLPKILLFIVYIFSFYLVMFLYYIYKILRYDLKFCKLGWRVFLVCLVKEYS